MKLNSLTTVFLFLVLATVVSTDAFAQTEQRLIDEFSRLPECDSLNRMDLFMYELIQDKSNRGVVNYYKGADELPGSDRSEFYLRMLKNAVVFRGFPQERIKFVDAGYRKEISVELIALPVDSPDPKPTKTVPKPKLPERPGFKWSRLYWGDYTRMFYSLEYLAREEEELSEYLSPDEDIDESEPTFEMGLSLKEYLKSRQDARVLIYYYFDRDRFDEQKIRDGINDIVVKNFIENGFRAERLIYKYGGYKKDLSISLDLWVIDQNQAYPQPEPDKKEIDGN